MADQRRDLEQRPSPEALLEAARREEGRGGKLKIFLGAAPGVGKTYEMLQQARARTQGRLRRRRRRRRDPRPQGDRGAAAKASRSSRAARIEYKGQWLEEMDLDAILARRPQIVLVDELAHTNAPGSRHPKRYLDVEELLSRGIDVYTTVNIQHIESLNDVVAQITRVRVRETVPDSILDRADAVELVDLTPDDLIQRLKEGKVYVPKQAERALEHYFSPGNLTALRELALRRTAERVDEQLLTHMQARAIPGPWAAGERVLVCVSEDPRAAGLVRYAKRLADRLHAPWTALYVETPAQPAADRGGARPHRRHAAAGRSARRRGGHHPGRRSAHRRRRARLCAGQQRHPDRHRQIDALALVRDSARLGRPRSGAPVRQHQRPRHRRRGRRRRADSEEDRPHRGSRRARIDPLPYAASAARGRCRTRRR